MLSRMLKNVELMSGSTINALVAKKTASKRNMPTTKCRAITSFRGLKVEERWTITYKCFVKNVTMIKVINDNHCRRSIPGNFFKTRFCLRLAMPPDPIPTGPVFYPQKYVLSKLTAKPY